MEKMEIRVRLLEIRGILHFLCNIPSLTPLPFAGMMLSAFFPVDANDAALLFEYLAYGSAIGTVFAALTFATAAVSLPMIADRDVDMITACISSINAVLRNKPAMLLWAVLIVVLTAVGFATACVGLVIIMPWLAYATWHAYRETLQPGDWPMLD